jgi:hypothetical protein
MDSRATERRQAPAGGTNLFGILTATSGRDIGILTCALVYVIRGVCPVLQAAQRE